MTHKTVKIITELINRKITLLTGSRTSASISSLDPEVLFGAAESQEGFFCSVTGSGHQCSASFFIPKETVDALQRSAEQFHSFVPEKTSVLSPEKQLVHSIVRQAFSLVCFLSEGTVSDPLLSITETGNRFSALFGQVSIPEESGGLLVYELGFTNSAAAPIGIVFSAMRKQMEDMEGRIGMQQYLPVIKTHFLQHADGQDPSTEESVAENGPDTALSNPADFFFSRMFLHDTTFPVKGNRGEFRVDPKEVRITDGKQLSGLPIGVLFQYQFTEGLAGSILYYYHCISTDDLTKRPFRGVAECADDVSAHVSSWGEKILREPVCLEKVKAMDFDPKVFKNYPGKNLIAVDFDCEYRENGTRSFFTVVTVILSVSLISQMVLKMVGEDRLEVLRENKNNIMLSLLDLNYLVSKQVFETFDDGEDLWFRGVSAGGGGAARIADPAALAVIEGLRDLDARSLHALVTQIFNRPELLTHFAGMMQTGPQWLRERFGQYLSGQQILNLFEHPVLFLGTNPVSFYYQAAESFAARFAGLVDPEKRQFPIALEHLFVQKYLIPKMEENKRAYTELLRDRQLAAYIEQLDAGTIRTHLNALQRKMLLHAAAGEAKEVQQKIASVYSSRGRALFLDDLSYLENQMQRKRYFDYTQLIDAKKRLETLIRIKILKPEQIRNMLVGLKKKADAAEKNKQIEQSAGYYLEGIGLFRDRPEMSSLFFYSQLFSCLVKLPSRRHEVIEMGEQLLRSEFFRSLKDPFIFEEKRTYCRDGNKPCQVVELKSVECIEGVPQLLAHMAEAYFKNFQYVQAHEKTVQALSILKQYSAEKTNGYTVISDLQKKIEQKLGTSCRGNNRWNN